MADTAARHDIRYEFKNLLTRKAEHAGRLAVLHPLMHPAKHAKWSELLSLGAKLMGTWRTRLLEWQTVGWKFSREPMNVTRMRNCPPAGYKTSTAPCMPCKRDAFCPWCLSRKVSALYHTVSGALTNAGEHILTAVGRHKVDSKRSLVKALHRANETMQRLLCGNLRFMTDTGGYAQVTAEPHDGDWLVTSRLLVLHPIDQNFDLIPDNWKIRGKHRPTVDDVAVAVARAARYPVFLMQGDASRAAEAISAREGLRLSAQFGTFRGTEATKLAKTSKKTDKAQAAKAVKAPKPKPVHEDPEPETVQPPVPEVVRKPRSLEYPSWFVDGDKK